jgi:hypothetical protein
MPMFLKASSLFCLALKNARNETFAACQPSRSLVGLGGCSWQFGRTHVVGAAL